MRRDFKGGTVAAVHRINIALRGGRDRMSSAGKKSSREDGPVLPEGEEESEQLASETEGQKEELKIEKIEEMEDEHEKAKRRKRGNNTQ
jgi:hypothetical protein